MKLLNIGFSLLLLALSGCSLFTVTPSSVTNGQRAAYNGVSLLQNRAEAIINRYAEDCKKAVQYHLHYVCEKEILDLQNSGWNKEYIDSQEIKLRKKRDEKIVKAHQDIDEIADDMRKQVKQNHEVVRQLIGAVYNYLSTTPIEVDGIDYLVEKLREVR